jgi:hypothetical protein
MEKVGMRFLFFPLTVNNLHYFHCLFIKKTLLGAIFWLNPPPSHTIPLTPSWHVLNCVMTTSPITLPIGYFPDENPSSAGKKFERSKYRGAESSGTTQGSTASTFSCGKPIFLLSGTTQGSTASTFSCGKPIVWVSEVFRKNKKGVCCHPRW